MSIIISPSILSADFSNLAAQVAEAKEGGADWLHIDVMDGHFVPNLTIGPLVVKALRGHCALPFDVHLMMERPEDYIDDFVMAGSDLITVHVEAQPHLHGTIQYIKSRDSTMDGDVKVKAGVSLNPSTPLSAIEPVMEDLDLILVMTVNPGFGGQKFIRSMLPKIEAAARLIEENGYGATLEVDGGIKPDNAGLVARAGADALVAGSAVFNGPGTIAENIEALKRVCEGIR